jgi:hypothetical protein
MCAKRPRGRAWEKGGEREGEPDRDRHGETKVGDRGGQRQETRQETGDRRKERSSKQTVQMPEPSTVMLPSVHGGMTQFARTLSGADAAPATCAGRWARARQQSARAKTPMVADGRSEL